jgi:Tfp pilus assembly protein PilW
MKTKRHNPRSRRERGQTLLEFTVMLAMMLSVLTILGLLTGVLGDYGWRILSLVGLKYP